MRDLAQAALHGKVFDDIVAELTRARSEIIQGDPVVVIEKIGEGRGLTEGERGGVLRYLIEGGDFTKWSLHSAPTRDSQDLRITSGLRKWSKWAMKSSPWAPAIRGPGSRVTAGNSERDGGSTR